MLKELEVKSQLSYLSLKQACYRHLLWVTATLSLQNLFLNLNPNQVFICMIFNDQVKFPMHKFESHAQRQSQLNMPH